MFNPDRPIERKRESGPETVLPALERALGEASLEDRKLFRSVVGQLNQFLFAEKESL